MQMFLRVCNISTQQQVLSELGRICSDVLPLKRPPPRAKKCISDCAGIQTQSRKIRLICECLHVVQGCLQMRNLSSPMACSHTTSAWTALLLPWPGYLTHPPVHGCIFRTNEITACYVIGGYPWQYVQQQCCQMACVTFSSCTYLEAPGSVK